MKVNRKEFKNEKVEMEGFVYDYETRVLSKKFLECIINNDKIRKTLSISDGKKQFTIPFEAVEKYLR